MSKRDAQFKMPAGLGVVRPSEIFARVCCDCGLAHAEQIVVKRGHGRDRIYAYSVRDEAATETWRRKKKLAEWLALRAVCNAHIRRIKGREKE